ncbi:MAG: 50S ribosomal protein L10 [Clostridia bacterium]|nr:50S ribosomal protein L10 [Clostridia bacterium]
MPSTQILEQKKQVVNEMVEKFKAASAGVFVDYRGLTVEEDTELRRKFREAGVEYKVVKNTLTSRAAKEVGLEALDPVLNGPTALAMSVDNPVAPAKIIAEFAKKHEALEVKAGFMDGAVMSVAEVNTLAATPTREELLAKMMGSMKSPISGLVRLLNTIVEGGEEMVDLAAKKAAEAAPTEEAAPAAEEAPAEAPAEEAPAAE